MANTRGGINELVGFMSCGRISAAILDWLGIHTFFGVTLAIFNFECFECINWIGFVCYLILKG